MSEGKRIRVPVDPEEIAGLAAGDRVLLSGVIYTGRDAAHKRMDQLLREGKELPMRLENQAIYYVGPCPARPGAIIGPCGPTTSGRMDRYAPTLLDLGLKVMIGKGQRSAEVKAAMKRNKAVYLVGVGGAAVIYANCVRKAEVFAFPDLGTEAIHRLEVEDFPLVVAVDAAGNDLYQIGPPRYASG